MNSGTQARADWRALFSAAVIGSGVGLGLGAGYLAGGLGQAALDHSTAVRVALAASGGFTNIATAPATAPNLAANAVMAQAAALPVGADPDAVAMAAAKPTRARELDCLAQAVYFEARGESARGQQAVATVIMNRVKNPSFPKTVCGVVYQGSAYRNGCQFSFACDGQAERVVESTAWDRARSVAARVLSGAVLRDIGSATHFHTTGVDPEWGGRMLRVAQVGLHVFYRFNPHAPRPTPADDDDDSAVFASAPAPANPQLRLAEAVVPPSPAEAARPVAAAPAPLDAKPSAKAAPAKAPAVKLPDLAPAGLAKTDAPQPPKPETSTTS